LRLRYRRSHQRGQAEALFAADDVGTDGKYCRDIDATDDTG
jgi:hypothetical protein